MGMCSFYTRFISDFSGISRPLAELLKKDVDVPTAWTEEHTKSINDLKKAMTTYPVLRQYDRRKPLFLVSDASDYAVGSCLYQYEGTNPVAIAYASKSMTTTERNYSVQEKEALGVIHAVDKFRHYLLGNPFTVQILTDHRSLEYLQTCREKGGRIARWAIKLGEYDYKVTYVKRADNTVAVLLSRLISATNQGHQDGLGAQPFSKSLTALMLPEVPGLHAALIREHGAEEHSVLNLIKINSVTTKQLVV
eukprot:SAG11_NODE_4773_length_1770_cov_3.372831_1_plen_250_part_00